MPFCQLFFPKKEKSDSYLLSEAMAVSKTGQDKCLAGLLTFYCNPPCFQKSANLGASTNLSVKDLFFTVYTSLENPTYRKDGTISCIGNDDTRLRCGSMHDLTIADIDRHMP